MADTVIKSNSWNYCSCKQKKPDGLSTAAYGNVSALTLGGSTTNCWMFQQNQEQLDKYKVQEMISATFTV